MFISLFREILLGLSSVVEEQLFRMNQRAWWLVASLGLALIGILLIFLAFCFFGFALYHLLLGSLGPQLTPFIIGCFFLLISVFTLIISKRIIRKE